MTKSNLWGQGQTQFFKELGPDLILNTVDGLGLRPTGRVMTLNSMENRVYEVEIESDSTNLSDHFKIIKFYRPGRWSKLQLLEEHLFLKELVEHEVPVIAPIAFPEFKEKTLFTLKEPNLFYTVFNKQGGRAPDELQDEDLEQIGRLLARLHNVGDIRIAPHRLKLSTELYLKSNLDFLLDQKIIPHHQETNFKNILEEIYLLTKNSFNNIHFLRVHGDCHLGNVLKRGDVFHLIDFDDSLMGPAMQDIWPLIPGRDDLDKNQRNILLDAYTTMRDFNYEELRLLEVLRTLRMINYCAWIAKRVDDPAFKNAFPLFGLESYWEDQMNDLRQQVFYLQEL